MSRSISQMTQQTSRSSRIGPENNQAPVLLSLLSPSGKLLALTSDISVRADGDERKVRKTPMAGRSNDGSGYPTNQKARGFEGQQKCRDSIDWQAAQHEEERQEVMSLFNSYSLSFFLLRTTVFLNMILIPIFSGCFCLGIRTLRLI
jgi:hypothetical protein